MSTRELHGSTRHVSFRMPVACHEDLLAHARAFGLDLSAVLNRLVADARPEIVRQTVAFTEALKKARAA